MFLGYQLAPLPLREFFLCQGIVPSRTQGDQVPSKSKGARKLRPNANRTDFVEGNVPLADDQSLSRLYLPQILRKVSFNLRDVCLDHDYVLAHAHGHSATKGGSPLPGLLVSLGRDTGEESETFSSPVT